MGIFPSVQEGGKGPGSGSMTSTTHVGRLLIALRLGRDRGVPRAGRGWTRRRARAGRPGRVVHRRRHRRRRRRHWKGRGVGRSLLARSLRAGRRLHRAPGPSGPGFLSRPPTRISVDSVSLETAKARLGESKLLQGRDSEGGVSAYPA